MGSGRTQSKRLDLFSTVPDREPHSLSSSSPTTLDTASSPRHVLPRDLPNAIKQLDNHELDRLRSAVLAEQKRRGGKIRGTIEPSRTQRGEAVDIPLTAGKLNSIRAAFKVG